MSDGGPAPRPGRSADQPPRQRTRGEVESILAAGRDQAPPSTSSIGAGIETGPFSDGEPCTVVSRSSPAASGGGRTLRIVLVAGPKDHGPGEHDYPGFQQSWAALLAKAPGVATATAFGWPDADQWAATDVVVLYFWNHAWSPSQYADLDAHLARGGGLVLVHAAIIEDQRPDELARRSGLAGRRPVMQFRHGPVRLCIPPSARQHPIVRGFTEIDLVDEAYWTFSGDERGVEVLGHSDEEGSPRPLLWTHETAEGRVFCSALGHYSWTFDDPLFRIVLLRAIAWVAREPAERLTSLATVGLALAR